LKDFSLLQPFPVETISIVVFQVLKIMFFL